MPRFDDGAIDMQELLRRLAEQVVNAVMDAEADQLCGGGANSRNGYRERGLATCVGTLTLRIPKLRTGSFFPDDVIERYQRADRALVAAVAEMYATGTSTRKVRRVAEKMVPSRFFRKLIEAASAPPCSSPPPSCSARPSPPASTCPGTSSCPIRAPRCTSASPSPASGPSCRPGRSLRLSSSA